MRKSKTVEVVAGAVWERGRKVTRIHTVTHTEVKIGQDSSYPGFSALLFTILYTLVLLMLNIFHFYYLQ